MGMRNVSLRFPPFRPLSAGRRFIAVYGGTHLFETCTAAPAGGGSRTGANRWNHFVKPSAELNAVRAMARREMDERSSTISLSRAQNRTLFGLCRGEKWTKKIQGYSSPVGFMKQGSIRNADTPLFLRIRGSELLREALADGQKIFGFERCAADQTSVDVLLGEDLGCVGRFARPP